MLVYTKMAGVYAVLQDKGQRMAQAGALEERTKFE